MIRKLQLLLRFRRLAALRCVHPGARVCARSQLRFPVQIAREAVLKRVRLESYAYVSRGSRLQDVSVGRYTSIGPECLIGGMGRHPTDYFSTSPVTYSRTNPVSVGLGGAERHIGFAETAPVEIAEDVWIGARCVIVDGVRIGRGAIIGANTVVVKDVPPYAVFFGSPPKLRRHRFSQEVIDALEQERWWEKSPAELDHERLEKIVGWSPPASCAE